MTWGKTFFQTRLLFWFFLRCVEAAPKKVFLRRATESQRERERAISSSVAALSISLSLHDMPRFVNNRKWQTMFMIFTLPWPSLSSRSTCICICFFLFCYFCARHTDTHTHTHEHTRINSIYCYLFRWVHRMHKFTDISHCRSLHFGVEQQQQQKQLETATKRGGRDVAVISGVRFKFPDEPEIQKHDLWSEWISDLFSTRISLLTIIV